MSWKSDDITELCKALHKAQGEMKAVKKGTSNDFFKSKYADLASIIEEMQPLLNKHGLAVTHLPIGDGEKVGVATILLHVSGQWIRSDVLVKPVKTDPQAAGSAITYCRRYGMSAVLNLATEDDDGEAASGRGSQKILKKFDPPKYDTAEKAKALEQLDKLVEEFEKDQKQQLLDMIEDNNIRSLPAKNITQFIKEVRDAG